MVLKYTLKFYDYWHISSGLSAGAKLDSSVIRDDDNLPYVAGKIVKGLVRETAELLDDANMIKQCFGNEGVDTGVCYFSNAVLDKNIAEQIKTNNLQNNLYDVIASTKIDGKTGVAQDKSLREIEVVIPLELYGEIRDIPDEYVGKMTQSLKMIKRMGLHRNRGLGRCEFVVEEGK